MSELGDYRQAVRRVDAEVLACLAVILGVQCVFDVFMERSVEGGDDFVPFLFACCYLVEVLFNVCRESVVEDSGEVCYEIVGNYHSYFLRQKTAFFRSYRFGFLRFGDAAVFEGQIGHRYVFSCLVAGDDVTPSFGEGVYRGAVGGRSSDTEFFELVYEGPVRVSCRRCGEFAKGVDFHALHFFSDRELRKDGLAVF